MKIKLKNLLKKLAGKILISARRYPEAISCALIASILAIIINRGGDAISKDALEVLGRIAMVFALLFPVSLIGSNIYERAGKTRLAKLLTDAGIAVFGVLYYFLLFPDFDFKSGVVYFAVSFAAYLLFIVVTELRIKKNFEVYTVNLAVRFFITYFYSMVLYGGIAAIFLTLDFLFAMDLSNKIYLDILIIVAGIFAPTFFLAEVPAKDTEYDISSFSTVIKVLLLYIVMPIISIYTVILYVYLVKVIFEGLPENMIANLILWYSIIGVLVSFLIYPFKRSNKWASLFIGYFPKVILPLIVMLFYSIILRISEYGFTESRYFVLVAGIWVFGAMIYLSIKKEARNMILPISLAIIAILTVIGPQSAFSISKASQNARLATILEQNDMLSDGVVIKGTYVSSEDKNSISSILRYFDSRHSLEDVKCLPDGFTLSNMEKVFGFTMYYDDIYTDKDQYFYFYSESGQLADISGYDYMVDLSQFYEMEYKYSENGLEISYDRKKYELYISYDDKTVVDEGLSYFADSILARYPDANYDERIEPDDMTFVYKGSGINVKIIIIRIDGSYNENGYPYLNADFILLIDIE